MIQILNSAAAGWSEYFLLAVIQNTVFLGLVFAALHILRGAPARVRYLVAMAGLIKLLLPPFMRIPTAAPVPGASGAEFGGLIPFMTGSAGGSAVAASGAAGESLTPAGALIGIIALIVLGRLAFTAGASVMLALRMRGARPVPAWELPEVPGIEDVSILRSGIIAVPITVAFLPGRIFVPDAWDGWTANCRRMVLMHEMAHLRRRDGFVLIMQMIARAIYFYHPLVAMLDRRLSGYREMACDDATVGRDRDSIVEYSRYLVEIAESIVRCPAVCGSASALIRRRNELLSRVSYQLEEGRMRSLSKTRWITLTAASVLLAVTLSWYRGGAAAAGDPPDPPAPPGPPGLEETGGLKQVKVYLEGDGAEIDGERTGLYDLLPGLLKIAGGAPGRIVINLVCDDDVPMRSVRVFQEAMLEGGISKINYVERGGGNLPLSLPPEKALERLEEFPGRLVIDVAVGAGGGITIGARKVRAGELKGAVEELLSETPAGVVVIHNDKDTSYGDFTRVLRLVKEAGAERVVVKFEGGE